MALRWIYGVAALGVLSGCASSTGILPAGPDTFTLETKVAPIRGGGEEAQRSALTEADAYCKQMGRQFVPSSMGKGGNLANPMGPTGYTVTFKCLLPGDPQIAGYQLQAAPNLVIEQRNR